jgi:EF-P beta-lysylation protein EpmB
MVTPPPPVRQVAPWQAELASAVRDLGELLAALELDEHALGAGWEDPAVRQRALAFPLRVPRGYVARMRRGDPRDPLLLQVLPVAREAAPAQGFGPDPLVEARATPTPGILHKYRGRLLWLVTGACAIHCRYCFRRHFPYAEHRLDEAGRAAALAYLGQDPTLHEVILSGGDPLAASDDKLAELAAELAAIPHLRRLRLHTRLPVVLPERVDRPLLAWLAGSRLAPVVVVHANHPREIDQAVAAALRRLRDAGVTVLNQTVLLRGINDQVATLAELSERLFAAGTLPYYLHLLDAVAGAAHFDVPEAEGRALAAGLAARLPGYLVPRLVREVPGAPAKTPIPLELTVDPFADG